MRYKPKYAARRRRPLRLALLLGGGALAVSGLLSYAIVGVVPEPPRELAAAPSHPTAPPERPLEPSPTPTPEPVVTLSEITTPTPTPSATRRVTPTPSRTARTATPTRTATVASASRTQPPATSSGSCSKPLSGGSANSANTRAVHQEICKNFPAVKSFGGYRPESGSFHGSGQAIDVMVGSDHTTGQAVATWAVANASRLGVVEVIWNARIWTAQRSSEGWRQCGTSQAGCYGGSDNTAAHRDHPHISVRG